MSNGEGDLSTSNNPKKAVGGSGSESGLETSEADGDGIASSSVQSTGPQNLDDEVASTGGGAAAPSETGETGETGEASAEVEYAEATSDKLASEAGEESAEADLESIVGYERHEVGESSESAESGESLQEAGAALEGQGESGQTEFAFLAALVPMLISNIGPPLAKLVLGRLSKRAQRRVRRIASVAGPAVSTIAGGRGGALGNIANVARMLVSATKKPGAESGAEVDEAVASEAVAALEVIIGRDDRVRITPTTKVPWKRFCALRITFPSGRTFRGSGSLISSRAVVTAGHCVFMRAEGGWARSVEVIPAMDGPTRPYGSATSSNLRSVVGWTTSQKPEYDYGCIILPQGAFGGRNLGRFGFAALSPSVMLAMPVVLAGYPGDKPFAELWGMSRKIKRITPRTLVYDIDTVGGQSGAPVYLKRSGKRYIVGIHNYGAASGNSATRVVPSVYQRLLAWSQIT
ncbi:MAG: hypothetical protein JWO24_3473 [Rhodospirillales bacterium]|nr:hypothetical protein [Rhodospirillales bacterium]